ncbi:MAG: TonB-dependent receptor, partial [Pseudomonadota bacterium]
KDVEVIVVTGENIKRNLIDTNTSANIQTFDNIVRSNDKRISDVFSRAANVNVNGTGLQAFTFSIRGINSSGIGGAGNGAVASLTVDGAAFTTQQLSRGYNSLFDVKQVEMLRGPQSTSQARNSLAGAVVVQTNDPEFEQRTRATAAIGNYGTYELGVANTGPITDNFAYRITLHRLNTDGFITNTALGIDDYNFNDTDTIRAKLLYQPDSIPLEILFSYSHVQSDARNDVSTWFPDMQQFVSANPFGSGGMDTEQDVTTLKLTYAFNEQWSLSSQTALNEFISEDLNSTYSVSLPDRDQAWFATADQDEWNQTIRLIYDGDAIRGAAGLFYSEDTNIVLRDGVAIQNFFMGLDGDALIDSPLETDTAAIFAEFDIEATEKTTFTLGARYEKIDISSISRTTINLILPPPAPYTVIVPALLDVDVDASTDFSVFLPKVGVTHALDENQRLGFTYSEGYRQGGVSIDPVSLSVGQFEPEFVKNYEFSYKSAFSNGMSLNANLFYLDWTDQQITDFVGGSPVALTVNAGESSVYGTEVEFAWQNDQWDTYATVGYVETEFDEFTTSSADLAGNEFPNAPSVTLALGSFYTLGDFTYGIEANYRDGFFIAANNAFETESLTAVDVSIAYNFENVSIRAFANNLFDEVELISDTFFIESIPHGNFSDPRTFGVQILYGF